MISFRRLAAVLLMSAVLAVPAYMAGPAAAQTAQEPDPLRIVIRIDRIDGVSAFF